jgi:hypothetical protein
MDIFKLTSYSSVSYFAFANLNCNDWTWLAFFDTIFLISVKIPIYEFMMDQHELTYEYIFNASERLLKRIIVGEGY